MRNISLTKQSQSFKLFLLSPLLICYYILNFEREKIQFPSFLNIYVNNCVDDI